MTKSKSSSLKVSKTWAKKVQVLAHSGAAQLSKSSKTSTAGRALRVLGDAVGALGSRSEEFGQDMPAWTGGGSLIAVARAARKVRRKGKVRRKATTKLAARKPARKRKKATPRATTKKRKAPRRKRKAA